MDFTNKCFVIMPISDQGDYPEGHFTKVYEQIIEPAISAAGYESYRVDENNICDSIIGKIFDAIQNCPMAICDLSNRNPNVLYELGLRQAYDKLVVLIQDDKTERIFDVSGISTITYKSKRLYEDVIEAREKIRNAIIETKEGRNHTLIQMVKATSAVYPEGEITHDDKNEILLQAIMREIYDLKNYMPIQKKPVVSIVLTEEMDIIEKIDKIEAMLFAIEKEYKTIDDNTAQSLYKTVSDTRARIARLSVGEEDRVKLYRRISAIRKRIRKLLVTTCK